MNTLDLILLCLATFYVSYVVSNTTGPFDVFSRLRGYIPLGGLMGCIMCLAVWVAVLLYVALSAGFRAPVEILGVAGAVVFVYRWTGGAHV